MFLRTLGRLAVISTMACGASHPPLVAAPVAPALALQLAVIPADSDVFPGAARAISRALTTAKLRGVEATRVSKAPLEVVQLSIECVDASAACYAAIGRSLAVNRLLFARIDGVKKRKLKVTITLYDVDAQAVTRTRMREFATEDAATAGADALVAEVTR